MNKIQILNDALFATGNNPVNVDDGSDEYQVANNAFERAARELLGRHPWLFAVVTEPLVRVPDTENKSRRFPSNGFRLPPNRVHLKTVFYGNVPLTDYEVQGDILSCNYSSDVYAAVVMPTNEERWHPVAIAVLTLMVEAGCLRGLNEDHSAADRREARAEGMLADARPTVDQQNPGRNYYVSKIALARRTRRK
ncbi:hypothetical protein [Gellertiella hungarica]|uniref:Uncharacterized protein n=1 Tax=Gellertiella hungarica TaxID=1572859 RepID=A0A7W6J8K1_9HYPH|nr:hypothetical protein [Gellertiella hungarica]MBB4066754.1 hypothetical protein [Gellertiella hungarica]